MPEYFLHVQIIEVFITINYYGQDDPIFLGVYDKNLPLSQYSYFDGFILAIYMYLGLLWSKNGNHPYNQVKQQKAA